VAVTDRLALCYHALSERWPAALAVRPGQFASQLDWLAGRGYRGVTFEDLVLGPDHGRRVAITFDDAFRSVLTHALPELDRLGWPATIFVPTEPVGAGGPLAWQGTSRWLETEHRSELAPLGWPELRDLAAAGWELGSHTLSHPHLTQLDKHSLDRELRGARRECERRLGRPCGSLAYPYGDVDDRVVEAAGRAGYLAGAALAERRRAPAPLEWPRVGVYRVDDLMRFRVKVGRGTRLVQRTPAWPAARALAGRLPPAADSRRVAG
jgi:peptidoglycan/xylan/chitin deacetylase (PgdA/CDA1 family)